MWVHLFLCGCLYGATAASFVFWASLMWAEQALALSLVLITMLMPGLLIEDLAFH